MMFNQQYQQNPNQVYWDANANQYYTMSAPTTGFGGNIMNNMRNNSSILGNYWNNPINTENRNYLGAILGGVNNKSMVDELMSKKQPYQYNVPSLASMFPALQGQMQGQMPMQGDSGAGRFMGGLLGAMPTPVSSTTTQAPSSSGAGRFL